MHGLEILELREAGEFWQVRTALHGKLAIPFDVHKSIRERYPHTADFEDFLGRQTRTLLEAYGDARDERPEPEAEFVV